MHTEAIHVYRDRRGVYHVERLVVDPDGAERPLLAPEGQCQSIEAALELIVPLHFVHGAGALLTIRLPDAERDQLEKFFAGENITMTVKHMGAPHP